MSSVNHSKVLDDLVNTNTWEYNHLKAAEELAELQEVILKKVTKKDGPKEPTNAQIIEELGDVQIRIMVLMEMYDPGFADNEDGEIAKRIESKIEKYATLIEEGTYKGRV